ncbi:MAG: WG repeat-containing protein [Bacteroidetes bacterium]|nr:MAG: WG repeat-containing protein [Bacteroidota bacterium]
MRPILTIVLLFLIVCAKGQDDYTFIPKKNKRKWGYVHYKTNELRFDFQYQAARSFKGKLAAIKKGGKWGFIDYDGQVVIEIKYDDVKEFDHEYCAVQQGKKWGVINKRGEVIVPFKYEDCVLWSNDLKAVATLNGQKGLITLSDSILLPFQYDEILKPHYADYITVHQGGKAAYLNENARFISEFEFDTFFNPNFMGLLVKQNGKFGIMNHSGELPIAAQYDSIVTFGMDAVEGLYFLCFRGGIQSVWTITGKESIPPHYHQIYPIFNIGNTISDTVMNAYSLLSTIVEVDGKYGILNAYSDDTLVQWYDSIIPYCTDDWEETGGCFKIGMRWKSDNSNFFLEKNLGDYGYYGLFWRNENNPYLIYALNNKFGIIHCDGRVLTEAKYSLKYLTDNAPVFDPQKKEWHFEKELLYDMETR